MSDLFTIKARVPLSEGVSVFYHQAKSVSVLEDSKGGGVYINFVSNGTEYHYHCGEVSKPHKFSIEASRVILENARGHTTANYTTNIHPKPNEKDIS